MSSPIYRFPFALTLLHAKISRYAWKPEKESMVQAAFNIFMILMHVVPNGIIDELEANLHNWRGICRSEGWPVSYDWKKYDPKKRGCGD
jgi:hypothetical protein